MSIIQMPEDLANKIAAGEVVERPASVVKELIENSIDAGSTWIKVEIKEAGLQQIKITDNGDGMSEEDCERAFLRHATSKIRNENDLFHVNTLGFRGEALASIASVSRLTIKTSQGDEAGTLLTMEGGKVVEKKKSDARKGTEIIVEDIFFNTPARLKYMKTIHTELGHITDHLNRLAFSHPEIRFEATHNGRDLFKTSGKGELLQVIANVYGMSVAKQMVPIEHQTLDFTITGYISKPEVTRASRNYITLLINGRYVKSIPLTKAIMEGYHTLLPIGRKPIAVISIVMDPILVDVNVHPAKLEARFSKDKELYTAIEETIKDKFRQLTLIPEMKQKPVQKEKNLQHTMNFEEPAREKEPINQNKIREYQPAFVQEDIPTKPQPPEIENEQAEAAAADNADPIEQHIPETPKISGSAAEERIPVMYPIGQLQGTYILAQNENGLYMIDQHAAQERIKYEYFKKKLGITTNEVQELLFPLTFEFSAQEALLIEQYKEQLEKVGLFFEPFGQHTFIIRSHPRWFPKNFEEEVIREMVDEVIHKGKVDVETIREDAAILMSCKRSIKANHYLNQDEMFRLLEDLRHTIDPFTCPHGRPIIVHFSSYELEKMFKRVM
ncbi:DNA mismatch repair endonuclease MutL [Virgibacillus sp. YIM 98842]|uniref:DNA mismatch repair endonuclease MutL n=1 Tax=Virgibacillus sp. YIM 98842 TaxID=2663533 RepID=UPI0013DC0FFC|nr:DNA mismatch repair endonuclease MutL [Virgibacillus sp. YIM 98842]